MADLGQILEEAQHRWLRPTEICEILRNYGQFRLTSTPPVKPSGLFFAYKLIVVLHFACEHIHVITVEFFLGQILFVDMVDVFVSRVS